MIREFPNGTTLYPEGISPHLVEELTQGAETSSYLQEKKITMIPPVVASERGIAQTVHVTA